MYLKNQTFAGLLVYIEFKKFSQRALCVDVFVEPKTTDTII